MPGPPFAFGAIFVLLAILVALFIPESSRSTLPQTTDDLSDQSGNSHNYLFGEARHRRSPLPELTGPNDIDGQNFDFVAYNKAFSPVDMQTDVSRYSYQDNRSSWTRLLSNWFDLKSANSADLQKSNIEFNSKRIFRQPLNKYKHAGIVEPLRRFFIGRSGYHHGTNLFPHSNTSYSKISSLVDNDELDHSSSSDPFLNNTSTGYLNTAASFMEAEAADLSNYRLNQDFSQILNKSPSDSDANLSGHVYMANSTSSQILALTQAG